VNGGVSLCNQLDCTWDLLLFGPGSPTRPKATKRAWDPAINHSHALQRLEGAKGCNAEVSCDHPLRSDKWFAGLQKTYRSGLTEKEVER